MRVALIADIHGNAVALEAVLAQVEGQVDRVLCLGDVASLGPEPATVVERLQALGCACVAGNHDAWLLQPELARCAGLAPPILAAVDWCRERLSAAQLGFVQGFVPELELELDGAGALLAVHGSPRSNMEDLLCTTPADEVERRLDGRRPAVLACAHTHLQMLRQHRGRLLVNPGSVGLPFREFVGGGRPEILDHAEYAVVESNAHGIGVDLRRVPLDRRALLEAVARTDHPLRETLVAAYS